MKTTKTNNSNQHHQPSTTHVPLKTDLFKTEMCRKWVEFGKCKYGKKCQYAHGYNELRNVVRHQKYKSKLCKNFHETGICPYGKRCNFIHNEEEEEALPTSTYTSPLLVPTNVEFPIVLQSPGADSVVSDSTEHHDIEDEEVEEDEIHQHHHLNKFQFGEEKKVVNLESDEDEEFESLEHEIFDLAENVTSMNFSPNESTSISPNSGKSKVTSILNFEEVFPTFDRRLSAFSKRCPESNDDLNFKFGSTFNQIF